MAARKVSGGTYQPQLAQALRSAESDRHIGVYGSFSFDLLPDFVPCLRDFLQSAAKNPSPGWPSFTPITCN
jgi:hypothetical protein